MQTENFPEELRAIQENAAVKPEGEDLVRLLRRWFEYAAPPSDTMKYGQLPYRFLNWLIGGRVLKVIEMLEYSTAPQDHAIAHKILEIGERKLPGPTMANAFCHGLWGRIGEELGNPTWGSNKGTIIVELPTEKIFRAYMEMEGCVYGKNRFFPAGYLRIDNATKLQMDSIQASYEGGNLSAYRLWGGGIWVYSVARTERTNAEERARGTALEAGLKANPNNWFFKAQIESDMFWKRATERWRANFPPKILDPEVQRKLTVYMEKHGDA